MAGSRELARPQPRMVRSYVRHRVMVSETASAAPLGLYGLLRLRFPGLAPWADIAPSLRDSSGATAGSSSSAWTHEEEPPRLAHRRFASFAVALLIALVLCMAVTRSADARPPGPDTTSQVTSEEDDSLSLLGILKAGGVIGWLIILSSIGASALVIEHVWTIRAGVFMPEGLGEQVRAQLTAGHVTQAQQQCKLQPSVLGYVLQAGLTEMESGWSESEKAMEDAIADQSARLFRKIEYLSVIGNIAPMLGLLGTVVGMIFAFREVATTQGAARAADLAEGIYLALVTTVLGLIVAIPSLAAFAVFRNRVDQLVAETAYVAQHVFAPLKRKQAMANREVPAPPPVAGGL